LPKVHIKNPLYTIIYGELIGTMYERKCPDLKINGIFYEVEGYTGIFNKGKIKNMLSNGLKQSPRVIIDNTNGTNEGFILRSIYSRIAGRSTITEVWVYEQGHLRVIYEKQ
jgi:hypothetical protein